MGGASYRGRSPSRVRNLRRRSLRCHCKKGTWKTRHCSCGRERLPALLLATPGLERCDLERLLAQAAAGNRALVSETESCHHWQTADQPRPRTLGPRAAPIRPGPSAAGGRATRTVCNKLSLCRLDKLVIRKAACCPCVNDVFDLGPL